MAQPSTEPSMEDILASIKRIIAEDGEAPTPARGAARARREAVAVPEADAVKTSVAFTIPARDEAPPTEPAVDTAADDVVPERASPFADRPTDTAIEEPADVLELTSPLPDERDPILSGAAEQASRSAFAALGQLQVRTEAAGQPGTLEGLVADLLKPMLREWLDRELPALVERLVAAEIQRVSGRG